MPSLKRGQDTVPSFPRDGEVLSNLRAEVNELRPKVIFLLENKSLDSCSRNWLNEFSLDETLNIEDSLTTTFLYVPIHHPLSSSFTKEKNSTLYLRVAAVFVKAKGTKLVRKVRKSEKILTDPRLIRSTWRALPFQCLK